MKKILMLLLIAALTAMNCRPAKKRIQFFGDSITQAGSNGDGYITRVKQFLQRDSLDRELEISGSGEIGDRIDNLLARVERDVLSKDPSLVVIWVGVNDVWMKRVKGRPTPENQFVADYSALLATLRSKGIRMMLCTPAVSGERQDGKNEFDHEMDKYSELIRQIAAKEKLPLVDMRRAFMEELKIKNPQNAGQGLLTVDSIHLSAAGNMLAAETIYKKLRSEVQMLNKR
jgi:lysophospholipase L1-like esterase